MSEPLGIALIGCGVVGGGVAKLLLEQGDRLAKRAGRPLVLRKVVVRDTEKLRAVSLPAELVTTDVASVLKDPAIHVGVELIGGTERARQVVLDLLQSGKHVVTANKALLAEHGTEIFETARKHERAVSFEASVMGGVPVIAVLAQCLAGNQIQALQGILNGTSNYILTAMSEQGETYRDALLEAQRLGYAEADPKLDVDGSDAAHKLALLARIAFGREVPFDQIHRQGIFDLQAVDIHFAQELGYTIKLLAEAWHDVSPDGGRHLALHVSPVLLRHQTLLAQVRGAYNAIRITTDAAGETLLYGPGAGQLPTASAVMADLIDLAVGRAQRTFQTLQLWQPDPSNLTLRASDSVKSRFYLRLLVIDRPGVMADITRALADHQISIASVVQHEALDGHEGDTVPLVIMTHAVLTQHFRAAAGTIDKLECVMTPSVYYPVAD